MSNASKIKVIAFDVNASADRVSGAGTYHPGLPKTAGLGQGYNKNDTQLFPSEAAS